MHSQTIRVNGVMATVGDAFMSISAARVALIEGARRAVKEPGTTSVVELYVSGAGLWQGPDAPPGRVRMSYVKPGTATTSPPSPSLLPALGGDKKGANSHSMAALFSRNICLSVHPMRKSSHLDSDVVSSCVD